MASNLVASNLGPPIFGNSHIGVPKTDPEQTVQLAVGSPRPKARKLGLDRPPNHKPKREGKNQHESTYMHGPTVWASTVQGQGSPPPGPLTPPALG